MQIKHDVKLAGIHPEIVIAAMVVNEMCREYGVEFVITCAKEGTHRKGSKHFVGQAIDVRTRDMALHNRKAFATSIAKAVGPEFDVVLEGNHLHIEFDPEC